MKGKKIVALAMCLLTALTATGCIDRRTTTIPIAVIGFSSEPTGRESLIMKGVAHYADENGVSYAYYQAEDTYDGRESAIRYAMNNRAKLVIMAEDSFSTTIFEKQYTYEQYDFALLGFAPLSPLTEEKVLTENVSIMNYDTWGMGYLTGKMLLAEGYTSVGYVGDRAYLDGMTSAMGSSISYAETSAPVKGWYDSGVEIVVAVDKLIDEVAPIAKSSGKKVVGTEYDRSYLGDCVLTSIVKDWELSAYAFTLLHETGYWRLWGENQLAGTERMVGANTPFSAFGNSNWFSLSDFSKLKQFKAEDQDLVYTYLASRK